MGTIDPSSRPPTPPGSGSSTPDQLRSSGGVLPPGPRSPSPSPLMALKGIFMPNADQLRSKIAEECPLLSTKLLEEAGLGQEELAFLKKQLPFDEAKTFYLTSFPKEELREAVQAWQTLGTDRAATREFQRAYQATQRAAHTMDHMISGRALGNFMLCTLQSRLGEKVEEFLNQLEPLRSRRPPIPRTHPDAAPARLFAHDNLLEPILGGTQPQRRANLFSTTLLALEDTAVLTNSQIIHDQLDNNIITPETARFEPKLCSRFPDAIGAWNEHHLSFPRFSPDSDQEILFNRPLELFATNPKTMATNTLTLPLPKNETKMREKDAYWFTHLLSYAVRGSGDLDGAIARVQTESDFFQSDFFKSEFGNDIEAFKSYLIRHADQFEQKWQEALIDLYRGQKETRDLDIYREAARTTYAADPGMFRYAAAQGNLFPIEGKLSLLPFEVPEDTPPGATVLAPLLALAWNTLIEEPEEEFSQEINGDLLGSQVAFSCRSEWRPIVGSDKGDTWLALTLRVRDLESGRVMERTTQYLRPSEEPLYRCVARLGAGRSIERDILLAQAQWLAGPQ